MTLHVSDMILLKLCAFSYMQFLLFLFHSNRIINGQNIYELHDQNIVIIRAHNLYYSVFPSHYHIDKLVLSYVSVRFMGLVRDINI